MYVYDDYLGKNYHDTIYLKIISISNDWSFEISKSLIRARFEASFTVALCYQHVSSISIHPLISTFSRISVNHSDLRRTQYQRTFS